MIIYFVMLIWNFIKFSISKGLKYLNQNKVFFPICFNFVEPSHQVGYYRKSGYGLNFKKSMLNN